jgi:hypothetical protein
VESSVRRGVLACSPAPCRYPEHRDADRPDPQSANADADSCAELAARRDWGRLGRFQGGGSLCHHLAAHVWCPPMVCASLSS